MDMQSMTETALQDVSQMLKSLADPTRLKIMKTLHEGEHSVSEIVAATDSLQANISKHLKILLQAGLLKHRKEGTTVYYAIADPCVDKICEAVCDGYVRLTRNKIKKIKL